MRIRRYEVGGITYTPFVPTQAVSSGAASSSGSSDSSDKISGTVKKEIIDILKENGIPSDVESFLQSAQTLLDKSKHLTAYSPFGGDSDDYDMSDIIRIQSLANRVKFNKTQYDNATKRLTDEYAWSEVALDNKGFMYAFDPESKDITKISASEYHNDPSKYQLLTNSDLLNYRENYKPFDNSSLADLQNAVGMKSITDYVRSVIKDFGKGSIEGYATKDKDSILNGFHFLMENGPDGFYKVKSENQLRDINRALTYLYNTLPENMKQLLRAKTAAEGGDPNGKDRFELLVQALSEHTSYNYSAEFDKSASDFDPLQSGKKGGSSSEQKVPDTYLYRVASLNGPRKDVMLAPKGSKIADTGLMITMGITNGAVVDKNEQRLGPMSLTEMLQNAEAVKAADASTIVLGNRVLNDSEYGAVMFDGNTECNTVILPYTYDNGRVVPDFNTFEKFNELQRAIANNRNLPKMEIDRMARDLGLNSDEYYYNSETNELTLTKTMPFLSFGAIVGDDSLDLSKDNKRYLSKIDKSTGKMYVNQYNNMLKYGKIQRTKSDVKLGAYDKATKGDFYRGLIYMAMPDAYRGAHLSLNQYMNKDDLTEFGRRTELRQQQVELQRQIQNSNGNIGSFIYE